MLKFKSIFLALLLAMSTLNLAYAAGHHGSRGHAGGKSHAGGKPSTKGHQKSSNSKNCKPYTYRPYYPGYYSNYRYQSSTGNLASATLPVDNYSTGHKVRNGLDGVANTAFALVFLPVAIVGTVATFIPELAIKAVNHKYDYPLTNKLVSGIQKVPMISFNTEADKKETAEYVDRFMEESRVRQGK